MIGTTVSHYKILEKIGEGGMGEVYLAEDTKLKRQVSLKFLSADVTKDEDRKQRFIQEARAAAAIQHPHIAAVHDIDETADGRTFIAMEYIPGDSLREVIASKKLSLRRSLELGFQIADGLAKAHDKGVVHRDVKPENVLVSEDGYAKIIDFGLAKLIEPLMESESEDAGETATKLKTKEGLVMGTVAYMSPEQARGEAIDARSDIFSFGAVLYEMISGESPFKRRSAVESLNAVIKDSAAPLSIEGIETPTEMQRILRKAMAKEPSERYQNMKDLALDLKELREEIGSTVSRPVVAVAPSAAKPKWLWGAVAAGVLALIGLAFYLGGRQPAAPPGIGASGRPAIAVMYFESMSGDEEIRWLSKGLPNMLITDLAQTPGLDVISSQRIQEILTEIGEDNLENINKSVVPEIARRAGAGAVVVGSIFKSGSEIRLDVQVQDVGTGRVLSAESVRGEDVFPLIDELTGRIRASLNLGDRPEGRPIADVTTPSLEAFQVYSEGLEAARNLRGDDARKHFERAVEIDPSFAMAYYRLWGVTRGQGEAARAEEYHKKTLELMDRLPEREKALVQATDLFRIQDKPEEAAETLERLVARYPDEGDAWDDLQGVYVWLNLTDKALDAAKRGVEAVPQSGPLRNQYGYLLLRSARYAEGIRELEKYAELSPNEPNPHDSLAEAYLFTGQPEKSLERYRHALVVDPTFGSSHFGLAWAYGMLGRYDEVVGEMAKATNAPNLTVSTSEALELESFVLSRVGRYREARGKLEEAAAIAESQSDVTGEVDVENFRALLDLEEGNDTQVVARIERTLERVPEIAESFIRDYSSLTAHFLAGLAEVRRGNLDPARAHLESLREIYDPAINWQNFMPWALEGEIALAGGDLAAAESAFASAEPELKMFFNMGSTTGNAFVNNLVFHDGPARVKVAQGDLAGAIRIYRKLNTPDISAKYTGILEPLFFLETARLLDKTGDKDGARADYERFLELWKDADADLPELKEARAYVAR